MLTEVFFNAIYYIQHCFICRPSDSTVSEDAGIEPRTVTNSALAVGRSNRSARSHPLLNYVAFTSFNHAFLMLFKHRVWFKTHVLTSVPGPDPAPDPPINQ
jgi:hypothetical protein